MTNINGLNTIAIIAHRGHYLDTLKTFLNWAERAVLYVLAGTTGLRRKELLNLTWCDVDLLADNSSVCVQASIAKNGKEAKQPIPAFVVRVLTTLKVAIKPKKSDRVFVSFGKWINTADLATAKIDLLDKDGNEIVFHSLRNSYISSC